MPILNNSPGYVSYGDSLSVRFGDVYVPLVDMREPLRLQCQHFLECVLTGQRSLSDGRDGLRVLRVLDLAEQEIDKAIKEVLVRDRFILGEVVENFEEAGDYSSVLFKQ